ncbi:MAG: archease [Gammaproteobacteria bacterium]|nr:MAG: archease [Gammaproteobacteria bacterium]
MANHWGHFSHDADIGIRACGATKAEAFEQAGRALTAIITRPDDVNPAQQIDIQCQAENDDILFADWLNAIIYQMAQQRMLFSKFDVDIKKGVLTAKIYGERIDIARHQPAVEIKGATYTTLEVKQVAPDQWCAQTVVDV